jgi:trehalose 6-phosphate synthase
VLWPAFHYRLDLVSFQREAWEDPALAQFAGEGQQMVIMDPQRIIWLDQR